MVLCERIAKFLVCAVFFITCSSAHLLEGIYCGKDNCYDVLGVTRDSTKSEISKKYRQLARLYHPDQHKGEKAKKEAEEKFTTLATAYEILKDEEERSDYDYMLDNPQEYYAHYYRYYRRRVAPKVDVRLVIAVTITIISIIQYYSAHDRYETAIKYFMTVPKYRNKALDIAKAETKDTQNKIKDRSKKLSKAEQREEMEKIIRRVIVENMDIKGSFAKPNITDILWVQLIIFPYTIYRFVAWHVRWIWKFNIKKEPYGEDEKLYLIRKNLGMGQHQFDALEDTTKSDYLEDELWVRENFLAWKQIQEEELKKNLAENNKYKQYRRYMKTHGVGRMTFDDS